MKIDKSKFFITVFSIFIFIFISGFLSGKAIYNGIRDYIFLIDKKGTQTVSSSLELPLPKPSSLSTEVNKIRLDLEKISINKFFIIYSVIYGDQSHAAYHLYLTDLNKEKLNKNTVSEIYLKTDSGEIVKPVAQLPVIKDFPEDQALEWKIKIIVKFPYITKRSAHSLIFKYDDQEFILNDISY